MIVGLSRLSKRQHNRGLEIDELSDLIVGSLAAGIVDSCADFSNQSQTEKLHAQDRREDAKQQQWVAGQVDPANDFHRRRSQQRTGSQSAQPQAQFAKQLHWTGKVLDHVFDGDQIQDYPKRATDAVLGLAELSGPMIGDYFDASRAKLIRKDRNETMHLAVELDLLGNLGADRLEGTTKIIDREIGKT